jgi:transcriptional regulator with XRE-family HTH domain
MTERFKILLEQLHLSPSEFADKIGVQRSSISHIISGRNKPSIDFLEKILNVFPDIDLTWLITGRISLQKDEISEQPGQGFDIFQQPNTPVIRDENKKPPTPADIEELEQIIFVYTNNTFRILKSSGQ